MSLILEALKKLERDKQVEGRSGFLVMAARPWPSPGEDRRGIVWIVLGGLVMMGLGAGLAVWLWGRGGGARPTMADGAPVASASAAALPVATTPATLPPTAAPTAAAPVVAAATATASLPPPVTRLVSPPPPVAAAPAASDLPPTAAAVVAPAAAPPARFRLTAISERDGKPVAMLNERMVFEGDSWDDVTVVRIGDSDVELKVAGKTVVVAF